MDPPLKVRIGIGLGTMTAAGTAERFAAVVDRCEELGFDSLWVSERVGAPDARPARGPGRRRRTHPTA